MILHENIYAYTNKKKEYFYAFYDFDLLINITLTYVSRKYTIKKEKMTTSYNSNKYV